MALSNIVPDLITNLTDNAIDVAVDADISFNLGKDVTAVNGKNITITAGGGEVITIAANDATQVSITSGVVTINPTLELLNGTNYTVAIEDGAFIDVNQNAVDGILATDGTLNFTTIAAIAPDIAGAISILDNAIDVAVDADISFNLGEDVTAVNGKNITITPGVGEPITIAANDQTQVSIASGGVVTINPTLELLNGTNYTVAIEDGAFIDVNQNAVDPILATDGTLNFTTIAAIAPDIAGDISILDNAIDVAVDADISFNLGEDVTAVDGKNITITPGVGEPITIAANDATQVSIASGGVVTINPTLELLNGTNYTVAIEDGAFIDVNQNAVDGILATDGTLNFTTIPAIAPDIAGDISILDNAIDVAVDADISFDLGEDVTAVDGKSITITPGVGEPITIAANDQTQVSIASGGVVTINPTLELLNGTNYTVAIEDGAFIDVNQNAVDGILATDGTLNFTTIPAIAPDIAGDISILDNAIDVAVDADISFNLGEDVTAVDGKNITITAGGGEVITIAANDATQVSITSGVVTINPTLELLNGTNYTVAIEDGAFIDGAGNAVDGILATDGTLNFTTIAAIVPEITGAISILDNAIDVAVNADISFNLGKDVTAVNGKNITITAGGGEVITIAANDATQVSITSGVVTINPTIELLNGTNYTVAIEDGAFIDVNGNAVDGILATDGTLNFTTIAATPVDTIAPAITGAISPSDNAMDVAVDADISFNLGESVTAVNGKNITLTDEDGNVTTIAADDAQVSITSGGVVTINPTNDLINGKSYTVAIEAGAFIDGAGNEFDGTLAADGTFDFTIVAANNNGGVDNDGNTTIMPISTTNTDTNGNVMEVIDLTEFAGKTVTGSFEINREAKYNNNVYFYKVDNNNGDIGSLTPDASGYLQTALNNVMNPTQALTTINEQTTTTSIEIAGGDILGIVMVADGTLEEAQSNLDSVKGVYFSFLGANTDNGSFDHIRLNGNSFEFEDLANGGDSDFNDFEINMDFTV